MTNESKNPGGQPTKFRKEYSAQAYKLCLLGHTDKELAQYFEVSQDTIDNWKKAYPKFKKALLDGKTVADAEVAQAFYKRALGFSYNEVTYEKVEAGDIKGIVIDSGENAVKDLYRKKVVTKLVIPDAGAALNWLKNRQKEKWRDKQVLEMDFDAMNDEQLDAIIERIKHS